MSEEHYNKLVVMIGQMAEQITEGVSVKIEEEVGKVRKELTEKIDKVHVELNEKIDKVHDELNEKIDSNTDALGRRIDDLTHYTKRRLEMNELHNQSTDARIGVMEMEIRDIKAQLNHQQP